MRTRYEYHISTCGVSPRLESDNLYVLCTTMDRLVVVHSILSSAQWAGWNAWDPTLMLYIKQFVTNRFHIGFHDKTATVVGSNTCRYCAGAVCLMPTKNKGFGTNSDTFYAYAHSMWPFHTCSPAATADTHLLSEAAKTWLSYSIRDVAKTERFGSKKWYRGAGYCARDGWVKLLYAAYGVV